LYRQEGSLLCRGGEISRSTMCDWMAVAADLLAPIVTLMMTKILESRVVQTDETPVKVQDHEGKGIKTGRLWDFIGDHYHRYVVYGYTEDRSGTGPAEIFKDSEGYLQADASSVFDQLYSSGKIIEVGCLMHARRKFYEARTSDPPRSHQALAWIGLLYDVEREAKEEHAAGDYEAFVAARQALRQERSRPIFQRFHACLETDAPKV